MTSNWLRHLLLDQVLTVEEYEDIPHPRLELHAHVLVKNIEAGCILGMVVIGPLVGLVRGRSLAAAMAGGARGGRVGVGILAPLSPLMVEGAVKNQEDERIYDRAFRIRYNSGQMRADRWAIGGGLSGGLLGLVSPAGAVTGSLLGIALGTLGAGVYTNKVLK